MLVDGVDAARDVVDGAVQCGIGFDLKQRLECLNGLTVGVAEPYQQLFGSRELGMKMGERWEAASGVSRVAAICCSSSSWRTRNSVIVMRCCLKNLLSSVSMA